MASRVCQGREHRSRRVLLWMAGVFASGQLLTGFVLDHVSARGRFNALFRQLDWLEQVPHDPAIYCFGSSCTGTALIDTDVAAALRAQGVGSDVDVFSMWVSAGDLLTSEFALEHVLGTGRQPRLAVIELMPEQLQRHYDFQEENVLHVLGWRETWRDRERLWRKGLLGPVVAARLLPLYVYRRELAHAAVDWCQGPGGRLISGKNATDGWTTAVHRKQSLRVFGRFPTGTPEIRNARVGNWVADHRTALSAYAVDPDATIVLQRILERCERAGVRVLLWSAPVCSERRQCYTPALEAAFRAEIERWQARYGFEYYDARATLRDDQLLDTHHPTRAGAEHFSRHFARDLLAPVWARVTRGAPVTATPTALGRE